MSIKINYHPDGTVIEYNNFDEIKSLIDFFYKKVEIKFSYPFYNKYLSFFANIKFSHWLSPCSLVVHGAEI